METQKVLELGKAGLGNSVAHSCRDGEKGRGEARRRPSAASAGRKGDRLEEGTEGEGWREP